METIRLVFDLYDPSFCHTTQSKLTVPASGFGERGSHQMSRPWLTGGSVHPCTLPRLWGQKPERKFAFLLTYRRHAVSYCVPGLKNGRTKNEERRTDGETAHFMCDRPMIVRQQGDGCFASLLRTREVPQLMVVGPFVRHYVSEFLCVTSITMNKKLVCHPER
ncbi:hypothetical protein [Desulfosporosinus sp.]|uniref:hypothetical protein n=1 Tax=Desulfosporosinus sp. TaxID=157907 RepID=UPI0025B7B49D|nr:hypothetical protein [Desulfosporosinus sp.]MBC2721732.1 hypothetical protein [Desulfosporosinus sp.]MBC2726342.1 hypothetical protein [Desulfosporosinus sp.]